MNIHLKVYKKARGGKSIESSEDAIAISRWRDFRKNLQNKVEKVEKLIKNNNLEERYELKEKGIFCCALADGAGSTFNAGSWAKKLAYSFVKKRPFDRLGFREWVTDMAKEWNKKIDPEKLSWYDFEKLRRRGSASTLLGLKIKKKSKKNGSTNIEWKTCAVGDSTFFLVRHGNLKESFPIKKISEFESNSPFISTNMSYNYKSLKRVQKKGGNCSHGDKILLASDALGEWMLGRAGKPSKWNDIINYLENDFEDAVSSLQKGGEMDRDDVTLVIIELAS